MIPIPPGRASRLRRRPGRMGRAVIGLAGGALMVAGCAAALDPRPDEVPAAERLALLNAGKPRVEEPAQFVPMLVSEVLALPRFAGRVTRDDLAAMAALEARGVTVTGYIATVFEAGDGDFHIQLTEAPPGRCLRGGGTNQLVTELTPSIQARKPAYAFARLFALCGQATPVRISGWLLNDWPHQDESWRGTPWEVHPVTRIEVCCWQEMR